MQNIIRKNIENYRKKCLIYNIEFGNAKICTTQDQIYE